MKRTKVLDRYGVFACDPGTTTGLAWGVLDFTKEADTVFDLVARDRRLTTEVAQRDPGPDGDWRDSELAAAKVIATRMMDLQFRWMLAGIPYSRHVWIFEDFILYPGSHSSSRSGLSPVRITSYIQGMLVNISPKLNYVYQSASEAVKFATNERLKKHGLWVVGSEHERFATRHMCVWASKHI